MSAAGKNSLTQRHEGTKGARNLLLCVFVSLCEINSGFARRRGGAEGALA
jgi:hypothetical protein